MRGVSPLIASVLLIVIVVSLTALISGWLTALTVGARETVSNRTETGVTCTGASLSVESVYVTTAVNASNGTARVIVKNDGLMDMTIQSAQLLNASGFNFSATNALPVPGFARGALRTLIFENASVNCTSFSQVIVSTECASADSKVTPNEC